MPWKMERILSHKDGMSVIGVSLFSFIHQNSSAMFCIDFAANKTRNILHRCSVSANFHGWEHKKKKKTFGLCNFDNTLSYIFSYLI